MTVIRAKLLRCVAHLCNATYKASKGSRCAPLGVVGNKQHGALIVSMQPKLNIRKRF